MRKTSSKWSKRAFFEKSEISDSKFQRSNPVRNIILCHRNRSHIVPIFYRWLTMIFEKKIWKFQVFTENRLFQNKLFLWTPYMEISCPKRAANCPNVSGRHPNRFLEIFQPCGKNVKIHFSTQNRVWGCTYTCRHALMLTLWDQQWRAVGRNEKLSLEMKYMNHFLSIKPKMSCLAPHNLLWDITKVAAIHSAQLQPQTGSGSNFGCVPQLIVRC